MEIAFEEEMSPQKKVTNPSVGAKPKIDMDFDTGITTEEIDQRETELTDALGNFIMFMLGDEDLPIEELGLEKGDLSAILDEIESSLAEHGIEIYRPLLVEGEDGSQHIYHSQFEGLI